MPHGDYKVRIRTTTKAPITKSAAKDKALAPREGKPLARALGSVGKRADLQKRPAQAHSTKPTMPKQLMTIDDLACRWRCAKKTIRNRLSSGELVLGTKVLGRILFDLDEVIAFETANRNSNNRSK